MNRFNCLGDVQHLDAQNFIKRKTIMQLTTIRTRGTLRNNLKIQRAKFNLMQYKNVN